MGKKRLLQKQVTGMLVLKVVYFDSSCATGLLTVTQVPALAEVEEVVASDTKRF